MNEDQAGFLLGRQMSNNMRMVIETLEYLEMRPDKQAALMLVDTEKVFDNVSWNFMIRTIETMGLGEFFGSAIKAI